MNDVLLVIFHVTNSVTVLRYWTITQDLVVLIFTLGNILRNLESAFILILGWRVAMRVWYGVVFLVIIM